MKDWVIYQYDVDHAFIYADLDKEIYVIQPIGFEKGTRKVCRLRKALYGLKQSPRLWYKHLTSILGDIGFKTLPYDDGVFIYTTEQIILICHVDDLLAFGASKAVIDKVL